MQPCKTGDQPYSDASPNGECSLVLPIQTKYLLTRLEYKYTTHLHYR